MKNRKIQISIIIPVFNEEQFIGSLLQQIFNQSFFEVIIIDGGSTDKTLEIAKRYNALIVKSEIRRRSYQMNKGAELATGEYILFLHADVSLPKKFKAIISNAIEHQIELANFRLKFDWNHWFLNVNSYFSRFRLNCFQFGDQGLLIQKTLFKDIGGFDNSFLLAEGNEIIRRARKVSNFEKLDASLLVSARKYKQHGAFLLQFKYYLVYALIRLGVRQDKLAKLIAFRKV